MAAPPNEENTGGMWVRHERDEELMAPRHMSEEEVRAFLTALPARTAKVATVRADGRPHLAPVWFDVDARIYQQDLAGDFLLHTALPGAQTDDPAKRLNSLWLSGSSDITRVASIPEWEDPPAGADVVLVPVPVRQGPDWVIALIGVVPSEVESTFPILGRVVGVMRKVD